MERRSGRASGGDREETQSPRPKKVKVGNGDKFLDG